MGIYRYLLLVLAAATFAVSCQQKVELPSTLALNPDNVRELRFSADGSQAWCGTAPVIPSFIVETNEENWDVTVESEGLWCFASKSSDGRGFTVSAVENTSKEPSLPATVIVSAGDAEPIEISVTQDGIAVNTLSVTPDDTELEFGVEGGSAIFEVATDAESWDAVADVDWIALTKDEKTNILTIVVGENNTPGAVEPASVTITAGNADPLVITVNREARNSIILDPDVESYAFGAEGGTASFKVETDAASFAVSCEGDGWLTVSENNGGFDLEAAANENNYDRRAVVKIIAGNATREFSVAQEGKDLMVYKVGDYWPDPDAVYENGVLVSGSEAQGIVFWVDPASEGYEIVDGVPQGTSGKVLSTKVVEEIWGPSAVVDATDMESGKNNMEKIYSYIQNNPGTSWETFPAFWWIITELNGKSSWSMSDDWYLPALMEVKQICAGVFGMVFEDLTDWVEGDQYASLDGINSDEAKAAQTAFNAKLEAAGGLPITGVVWSSTEMDTYGSYALNFYWGQYSDWSKAYGDYLVLGVRKF